MDSSSIINYIKTNYPKVIFKPFALKYKNAIGFIVSDNKLVIGFVNNDGNLCKLAEPIDIGKLGKENGNKEIIDIIERIPVVSGFTENDKKNLLKMFKNDTSLSKVETISKDEHNLIVEDLKKTLKTEGEEKEKYKVMYDSKSNEIVLIKGEYEEKIKRLQKQYDELNNQLQICKNTILNKGEEISNIIDKYKLEIREIINDKETKISELDDINKQIKNENKSLQTKLEELIKNESKISELDDINKQIKDENKSLQTKLEELIKNESKISELDDINKQIKNENKSLQTKVEELIKKEGKISELDDINKQIKDENKSLQTKVEELIKKEGKISELDDINKQIKDENKSLQTKLEELIKNEKKLAKEQDEKSNEIQRLKIGVKDVQDKLKDVTRQLDIEIENAKMYKLKDQEIKDLKDIIEKMKIKSVEQKMVEAKLEKAKYDFTDCSAIIKSFSNINNEFYRRQNVIRRLDQLIETIPNIDRDILEKYTILKNDINSYINNFDFNKYTKDDLFLKLSNPVTKEQVSDDDTREYCNKLQDINNKWNINVNDFVEQTRILDDIVNYFDNLLNVPPPQYTEPEPTVTEPTITEPTVTEPTVTEPEPTVTEPEPTVTEPEPTITEPTVTEPEPTITEPTVTEPEPTVTEPTVTEPEPTVTEPEPTVTEPEPTVTEPTVTEPEPTVTEPEPTVTEPTVTEPEPTVTEPEPTVTEEVNKYNKKLEERLLRVIYTDNEQQIINGNDINEIIYVLNTKLNILNETLSIKPDDAVLLDKIKILQDMMNISEINGDNYVDILLNTYMKVISKFTTSPAMIKLTSLELDELRDIILRADVQLWYKRDNEVKVMLKNEMFNVIQMFLYIEITQLMKSSAKEIATFKKNYLMNSLDDINNDTLNFLSFVSGDSSSSYLYIKRFSDIINSLLDNREGGFVIYIKNVIANYIISNISLFVGFYKIYKFIEGDINGQFQVQLNEFLKNKVKNNVLTYVKIRNDDNQTYNSRFKVFYNINPTRYDNQDKTLMIVKYNDHNIPYFENIDNKWKPSKVLEENFGKISNQPFKDYFKVLANDIDVLKYDHTYMLGPFTNIFSQNLKNDVIALNMQDVINSLILKKPVFVMGYGASGSGKTSSLIYFNKSVDENQKNGILMHLTTIMGKDHGYNKISVKSFEFLKKGDSEKTIIYSSPNQNLNTIDFTFNGSNFELEYDYEHLNHFINRTRERTTLFKKGSSIGEIIIHLVDTDRFVKATTNNPNSSRSHTLIFIKFKNALGDQTTLILGDFAGVENLFDCKDDNVINKFLNIKKDDESGMRFYSQLDQIGGRSDDLEYMYEVLKTAQKIGDKAYIERLTKQIESIKQKQALEQVTQISPEPEEESIKEESIKEVSEEPSETISEVSEEPSETISEVSEEPSETIKEVSETIKEEPISEVPISEVSGESSETISEVSEEPSETIKEESISEVSGEPSETISEVSEEPSETISEVSEDLSEMVSEVSSEEPSERQSVWTAPDIEKELAAIELDDDMCNEYITKNEDLYVFDKFTKIREKKGDNINKIIRDSRFYSKPGNYYEMQKNILIFISEKYLPDDEKEKISIQGDIFNFVKKLINKGVNVFDESSKNDLNNAIQIAEDIFAFFKSKNPLKVNSEKETNQIKNDFFNYVMQKIEYSYLTDIDIIYPKGTILRDLADAKEGITKINSVQDEIKNNRDAWGSNPYEEMNKMKSILKKHFEKRKGLVNEFINGKVTNFSDKILFDYYLNLNIKCKRSERKCQKLLRNKGENMSEFIEKWRKTFSNPIFKTINIKVDNTDTLPTNVGDGRGSIFEDTWNSFIKFYENSGESDDFVFMLKEVINYIYYDLNDILKETLCRINYGRKICNIRRNEGVMINNSLKDIREMIKHILIEKNKSSINISPLFIEACLSNYCIDDNCFPRLQTNTSISSSIFDKIKEELGNENALKDIIMCIFCVINISKNANNPPPIPYIDINNILYELNHDYNKKLFDINSRFFKEAISLIDKLEKFKDKIDEILKSDIYINFKEVIYNIKDNQNMFIDNNENDKLKIKIKIFLEEINKLNAASTIGTLQYVDNISKFNTTELICSIDNIDDYNSFIKKYNFIDIVKGTRL
jgi:hypothetical protein